VAALRPAVEAAEGSAPLRRFYLESVRPFLLSDGRRGPLADPHDAQQMAQALFRALPPGLHETGHQLAAIAAERRDFAVQARLHHWLHGWLLVHVPLSAALLVLLLAHIVMALRYSY
jgi:hypothetical protein